MTHPENQLQTQPEVEQPASSESRERKQRQIVAVCFFFIIIILWLAVHFVNKALNTKGAAEGERLRFRVVEISPGSSVSEIARTLATERVISNEVFFKVAAIVQRSTRELKAGEYRFDTSMTLYEVLSWLKQGRVMLHKFTIPEGYTVRQIAKRLDKMELADAEEFMSLANNPDFCRELGVEETTLEGFLFPDTYKIAKGLSTKTVIRIMVDRTRSVYLEELREEIAASGSQVRDIVTIASIIEKETLYEDEEPLVAGVIKNRLERGIPLQCDVTIRYALDNYGVPLTYADLRMDSPYNSYLHPGLPPTPICNPGLSAIKAALNPAETDYMYFVSMNNGRHKFSTSLTDHNKAVHKYQILNEKG